MVKNKLIIKIMGVISVIVVAGILIFILITKDKTNLKAHCASAICNEANTICFNYKMNEDNTTEIIWKGDCSSLK